MSVVEYWALHGYQYAASGKGTQPIDREEAKDTFAEMRKKGLIK